MKKSRLNRLLLSVMGIVFCLMVFMFSAGCNNGYSVDMVPDKNDGDSITAAGFDGGAGPFAVPTGYGDCRGVWIEISTENDSASTVNLYLDLSSTEGQGSSIELTLQPGDLSKEIYFINLNQLAEGTALYLWHNDTGPGAAVDLTDITITAVPKYWLF